jgi:hypothetical protein
VVDWPGWGHRPADKVDVDLGLVGPTVQDFEIRACLERRNRKYRNHRNHRNEGKMNEENRGMKNIGKTQQKMFGIQESQNIRN